MQNYHGEISAQLATALVNKNMSRLPSMGCASFYFLQSELGTGAWLENRSGCYFLHCDRLPKGYKVYKVNSSAFGLTIIAKTPERAERYFRMRGGHYHKYSPVTVTEL